MQKKHISSQLGTTWGDWLHRGLKALQLTKKSGRRTKSVSKHVSVRPVFTDAMDRASPDKHTLSISIPAYSPIGPAISPPAAIPPLPAGKLGEVIRLMSHKSGTTIDDLMILTAWRRHTVRAALCRLRQRGFVIMANQRNRQTIYTLQQGK